MWAGEGSGWLLSPRAARAGQGSSGLCLWCCVVCVVCLACLRPCWGLDAVIGLCAQGAWHALCEQSLGFRMVLVIGTVPIGCRIFAFGALKLGLGRFRSVVFAAFSRAALAALLSSHPFSESGSSSLHLDVPRS